MLAGTRAADEGALGRERPGERVRTDGTMSQPSSAVTNVRVFDGAELRPGLWTATLAHGLITAVEPMRAVGVETADEAVLDGGGGTLLPGLIDTHVHVDQLEHLQHATEWGVTTQLDMGAPHLQQTLDLRGTPGLSDLRIAGVPALAPGAGQLGSMGFDPGIAVDGPDDAARFVGTRIDQGADHIKIILEDSHLPGAKPLSDETTAAIARVAHAAGLVVVAHVTSVETIAKAVRADVDVVTHASLTAQLPPELEREIAERALVVVLVPTLSMMHGVAERMGPRLPPTAPRMDYANAEATVATFRRAGRTVLAGTDANASAASPFQPPHGVSLHEELQRLVAAGLTPVEALQGATSSAARAFGLTDRGVIAPGRRADLLLVDGDPTADVVATRSIRGVWIAGEPVR